MSDSYVWSVDRLAASNLQMSLGLDFSGEQKERIAEHFARHRVESYEWVAERVHTNVMEALENASLNLCRHNDEEWSEGFLRAEQVVMTMSPEDLLGIESGQARSKGQVLRAMMRQARGR